MAARVSPDERVSATPVRRDEIFAAVAAATARVRASTRRAPPPGASPASVAASAGSTLAGIGVDVLARASFPELTVDVVACRSDSPAERDKCFRARAEHANLLARAKRTPRAVRDATDVLDPLPTTTHVYVTHDHPASRHTFAAARVFVRGGPDVVAVVDRFLVTGLATVPHPTRFPRFAAELLLEACDEVARRAGAKTIVVHALEGTHPTEIRGAPAGWDPTSRNPDPDADRDDDGDANRAEETPSFGRIVARRRTIAPVDDEKKDRHDARDERRTIAPIDGSEKTFAIAPHTRRRSDARRSTRVDGAMRVAAAATIRALRLADEPHDALSFAAVAATVRAAFLPSVSREESFRGLVGASVGGGVADDAFLRAVESLARISPDAPVEITHAPNAFDARTVADAAARDAVVVVVARTLARLFREPKAVDGNVRNEGTKLVADDAPKEKSSEKSSLTSSSSALRAAVASLRNATGPAGLLLVFRAVHLSDEVGAPRRPAIELESGARVSASELVRVAAEFGLVLDPAGLFFSDDPEARRAAKAKTESKYDVGHDGDDAKRAPSTAFVGCGRFRKVGYVVRQAASADVSSLVDVEANNWDETQTEMRTPRAVVEERVANNPAGNLAVADAETGACRGGVYFQRVARRDVAGSAPWREKELGRGPPDAPWVQLMDIHVCQAFSRSLGRAVGNELREFVLNCALVDPNTEGVCAVTRTRGFRRTQTRTNETYESYVTRGDGSHDRGLLFHVGGGARVVRAVQNWRPADIENDGKGTLIEYPLREIRRARWDAAFEGATSTLFEPERRDVRERATTEDASVVTVAFDDGSGCGLPAAKMRSLRHARASRESILERFSSSSDSDEDDAR